jgi:predicted enzyme related to lactoylglutathione lyase
MPYLHVGFSMCNPHGVMHCELTRNGLWLMDPCVANRMIINLREINLADKFASSREVIIRTDAWDEATRFYKSVLGLPITYRSSTMLGFETGAFCLYVEKGAKHGPVFEFLVLDVNAAKARLVAAGCTVEEEDAALPRCYIRDPYGVMFNIGQAPTVK